MSSTFINLTNILDDPSLQSPTSGELCLEEALQLLDKAQEHEAKASTITGHINMLNNDNWQSLKRISKSKENG